MFQIKLLPVRSTRSKQRLFFFLPLALAIFVLFSLSSCATKMNFAVSPVAPAANGYVKVDKNKNGNYVLTVVTVNLAPPGKLSPPREVYVVWMETKDNPVRNIGMIKSVTSFFSDELNGEMKASSTLKPTAVFITAEKAGTVTYPGTPIVLRTK